MEEIRSVVKAAVFVLSVWGCGFAVHRVLKIHAYFTPVFTMAGISLILYAGGLFGALRPAAYLVLAGGLAGSAYFFCLLLRRKTGIHMPGFFGVCFGAVALVFAGLILHLKLLHYDNFSHWAVMVKYLLSAHRFPGLDTEMVTFLDYPPGSSVFIYYVCLFLGRSQGVMLLAHNALIFACFLAVFGVVEERRRFLLYSFLAMGCSMLSYLNLTIRINNLLVDFLLPLLAMASIACSYRYRRQRWRASLLSGVILGYLGIVKNTGLIFAAFAFVPYLRNVFSRFTRRPLGEREGEGARPGSKGTGWTAALLTAAAAVLPYLLWQYHLETALAGYEGKFSLSAAGGNPGSVTADAGMYGVIAGRFVREALDLSGRAAQVFLLCNLAAAGAVVFARLHLKRRWGLLRTLLLGDAMTVGYYAGILGLYLFSMPEEEALRLAGFERYACSIMVLFAGLLFMRAVVDMEHSFAVDIDEAGAYRAYSSPAAKRRYQYGVLVTFVVALNFIFSEYNGLAAVQREYGNSLPGKAEKIMGDRWYPGGTEDQRRYLVAVTDKGGQVTYGEAEYVSRYFLYAPDVDVTDHLDEETVRTAAGEYEFIVILEPEAVSDRVTELYGGMFRAPGIYPAAVPDIVQ